VLPAGELRVRALARCSRARSWYFSGDPRALQIAVEGEDLARRSGDRRIRAACLSAMASELSRRAALDSALAVYRTLIWEYRRIRDRAGLAQSLQWRSHLYRSIGWIAKARRDADEAIAEAKASGAAGVIPWALGTLAFSSLSLGDVAGAAPAAAEATRLFRAQGDRFGAITARGLEGELAAATGDWATAKSIFVEVLAAADAAGWVQVQVQLHQSLMAAALHEGDLVVARREAFAAESLARARDMPGLAKPMAYHQGVIALRSGDLARAERLFRQHLSGVIAIQPHWMYMTMARLAEVYARQGRIHDAALAILRADSALGEWRDRLRDRELRLLALQISEDRADPDLGVATVLGTLAPREGYWATALLVSERLRARDLADRLNRAAIAADTTSGDRAIRSDSVLSVKAMMDAVPDDSTAVLEFVTGGGNERTVAFSFTWREGLVSSQPPIDSLIGPIDRFVALLRSGEDHRPLAAALGNALLRRPLQLLAPSVRRLVIVPDGPLHRLPFDALEVEGKPILERYTVTYAPSANVAVRLWQMTPAPRSPVLVFADPRFAGETRGDTDADAFRSAFAGHSGLPRLPGTSREAKAITRRAGDATVRRRAAASEGWLKQNRLGQYGVVHFATHALVDEGTVANTALALAPSEGEDGFVGPAELTQLRLAADLVVLSACQTAGGVVLRGEGVQGLAAPLLAAGARAVAATWWPIGDQATVQVVDDFYAALSRGLPVGDALREAKLAALRRGAPAREWAAFTIVGDPLSRPALSPPRSGPPVGLIGALVVLAGLAAYGVAMRNRRTRERASVPSPNMARTQ
jgi:tetratricopeptide (TPR) repeat protein